MSDEKQESLADIVADMRGLSKLDTMIAPRDATGRLLAITIKGKPIYIYLVELADRIEAAAKREREAAEADALTVGGVVEAGRHKPGNAAAMRDALVAVKKLFDGRLMFQQAIRACHEKVNRALCRTASQLRCRPGGAAGGKIRTLLYKFTRDGMRCETCPCCGQFPFGKCEFVWAQMPYEEGVQNDV